MSVDPIAVDSTRYCDDCGALGAADVDVTHWRVVGGRHKRGEVEKVVRRWCCPKHIAARMQAGLKVTAHVVEDDEDPPVDGEPGS